uniref:WW domain-containing protein n=1 Tax=Pseudonaja textilis TaxID=8673 RepID=A0A670Z2P5_PSETE
MRVQDTSGTYYWHIPTGTTQWEPPLCNGRGDSAGNTPTRETQVEGWGVVLAPFCPKAPSSNPGWPMGWAKSPRGHGVGVGGWGASKGTKEILALSALGKG